MTNIVCKKIKLIELSQDRISKMTTPNEFRKVGKEMVDYIADYVENLRSFKPVADVEEGYLQDLMPDTAPMNSESYEDLMSDVSKLILPGITNWNHPNFHAYFIIGSGFPGILADMLSDGIGSNGFSWASSPAYTELEMKMMDWLANLLHLPEHFLFSHPGPGGGSLQAYASEATVVALMVARSKSHAKSGDSKNNFGRLVAYVSEYGHSSVERAGLFAGVTFKILPTDEKFALRGPTLKEAIRKDREAGLVPCCCVANLGSTTSCAFDNLEELGEVCETEDVFLHVDAAYGGAIFSCEEFLPLMKGVERADSFNVNVHKLMLVQPDCSALWFKDSNVLTDMFKVDPLYLTHGIDRKVVDFRHWQIPLGKRFRALKVWFTLRLYGVKGMQEHVRDHVKLAKQFEQLVREDERFEVCAPVIAGLVCFRLKGSDDMTKKLFDRISEEGKIHLVPSTLGGKYILRFAICHGNKHDDIIYGFNVIQSYIDAILKESK